MTASNRELALEALVEAAPAGSFGEFISEIESETEIEIRFQSLLTSYSDWNWTVILSKPDKRRAATVSEVLLLATESSLVSPPWVPWSERLAEYRRLRKERREALALAKENGELVDEADEDELEIVPDDELTEDADWEHLDENAIGDELEVDVPELELADSDIEKTDDAEAEAKDGGVKPPNKTRTRKRVVKNNSND